jgi:hypothetical protein
MLSFGAVRILQETPGARLLGYPIPNPLFFAMVTHGNAGFRALFPTPSKLLISALPF